MSFSKLALAQSTDPKIDPDTAQVVSVRETTTQTRTRPNDNGNDFEKNNQNEPLFQETIIEGYTHNDFDEIVKDDELQHQNAKVEGITKDKDNHPQETTFEDKDNIMNQDQTIQHVNDFNNFNDIHKPNLDSDFNNFKDIDQNYNSVIEKGASDNNPDIRQQIEAHHTDGFTGANGKGDIRQQIAAHHPDGFTGTNGKVDIRDAILAHHPDGFRPQDTGTDTNTDTPALHPNLTADIYSSLGVLAFGVTAFLVFLLVNKLVRRRRRAKKLSAEVYKCLALFDIGNVDITKAITGGWHGTYKNTLKDRGDTDSDNSVDAELGNEHEYDDVDAAIDDGYDEDLKKKYSDKKDRTVDTRSMDSRSMGSRSSFKSCYSDESFVFQDESDLKVGDMNIYFKDDEDIEDSECSDDDSEDDTVFTLVRTKSGSKMLTKLGAKTFSKTSSHRGIV